MAIINSNNLTKYDNVENVENSVDNSNRYTVGKNYTARLRNNIINLTCKNPFHISSPVYIDDYLFDICSMPDCLPFSMASVLQANQEE